MMALTVMSPGVKELVLAAGAPEEALTRLGAWFENPEGHDELRVVVISATIQALVITSGLADPSKLELMGTTPNPDPSKFN